MDLDAYSAVHGRTWARLDELARRRRLDGAEADPSQLAGQAFCADQVPNPLADLL